MEQSIRRRYPIGLQDFPILRQEGYVYVDKTELVYRLTHGDARFVFLSRPRRFGKSLLVSTLRAYFEGRRDLFTGLAVDRLETDWEPYPVIHIDLSQVHYDDPDKLQKFLFHLLDKNAERLGVEPQGETLEIRFASLISNARKTMGRQVVVLIDEYDSPLLDVMHLEDRLVEVRQLMRSFYSPLKAATPYLRFVFLTGITKFSQLSIFSELNNIHNISMQPPYATICGISREELLTQLIQDIDILAEKTGKTREETITKLVEYYDGYHFCLPSPDIFNPYSLVTAFVNGRIGAYWFASGTPTFLIETLRQFGVVPSKIGQHEVLVDDFDAPTERMTDVTPLLYQSGYLTIKDYNPDNDTYRLDLPNREIEIGLLRSLMPDYVLMPARLGNQALAHMHTALLQRDMDGALRVMQTFLSTIPYTDNTAYEGHYQQVLYILFSLLGYYVDVEVHTATGRVDLVMRTRTDLYLIEVKLNSSAEAALRQITLRDYAARFATCGLPLTRVGINFSQETRTLGGWTIERVTP